MFLTTKNIADAFMISGVVKMPFKFLGSEVWLTTSALTTCLVTVMILIFVLLSRKFILNAVANPLKAPSGIQDL